MTDNHDYTTPSEGTTNWDVPLNDNFRAIDTDVEIRDTDAARGDYVPKDGSKYLATDTGAVYIGDGDQWVHVGDVRELAGDVYVQGNEPIEPSADDIWLNTGSPGLSFYDGSQWFLVTGSTDGGDSTASVVEDGEGDLSSYTGETGYFSITSNALSGTGSILGEAAEHGSYRTMVSTSGLDTYPQPGDSFTATINVQNHANYGAILWGVQSESAPFPGYRFTIDTGAMAGVKFEKVPPGGPIESDNLDSQYKLSSGEYHDDAYNEIFEEGGTWRVEVDWETDGSMPWRLYDVSSGSLVFQDTAPDPDTEYTDGGIGFMLSDSWESYEQSVSARFDDYELI